MIVRKAVVEVTTILVEVEVSIKRISVCENIDIK